ncbi:MAG TPA: RNA polymerase sigma factor RpoD/SigA [Planctomycetota bacterium]|nr:RNA polymerase sigma factor RpoD/SigA [Planctomycetota bacterium]
MAASSRNRGRTSYALSELDKELDVPTERFDRNAERLAKAMIARGISVTVPPASLASVSGIDSRTQWPSFYDAQIQRLPRLDRAEEFAFARRYEFMKKRVSLALEAAGVDPAAAKKAVSPPTLLTPEDVEKMPRRKRWRALPPAKQKAAVAYAVQAMRELQDLRNLFVEGSLYMVLATVQRYRGLGVDVVDLVQEGNASLFQAIEGFDWRRDVRFRTYAQFWIQQAILKTLYNASRTVRVPIWVQKTLKKIQRLREQHVDAEGRPLSNEEIAKRLDLPVERVEELMSVRRYAVSIDQERPGMEGHSLAQEIADESLQPVEDQIVEDDLPARLGEAMADLPARERMILNRRYGLDGGEPETLGDIAQDLGISAERVRQLQNAALGRLRVPRKLALLKAFAG